MRPFSLRRSLCIMLLVVATVSPLYADWNSSQINTVLQELTYISARLNSQSHNGYSTAEYLSMIQTLLSSNLSDIRSNSDSQVQTLGNLDSALSDITDLVQTISDSMSSETEIDFSEIITKLDSLQSAISSYSTSVSSIETLLSALSSNQVNPDELLQSITDVSSALSSITTYSQFSSQMDGLKEEISDIAARLDSTLDVSGQIDISSGSLGPVVNAIGQLRQKVFDFETNFLVWYAGRSDGYYNEHTWMDFANKFDGFLLSFDSALTAIQGIYAYLNGEFKEKFSDVWTNTTAYLPYLTNGFDSAFLNVLSNNLANIPLFPNDPAWTTTANNISYYNLARFLGGLLSNQSHKDGISVGTFVPGAPSEALIRRFFQRGGPSQLSEHEKGFGQYSSQMDDQRRFIFSISNTVPYIEGMPRHRQKVGGAGDTWTGAFGDLEWSGGNPQPVSGSPNRTPWNTGYFSTDYFADLLKLLAATNLVQDAFYSQKILDALAVGLPSEDDDIPMDYITNNFTGPVFTNPASIMVPEKLFPTEVNVSDLEIPAFNQFESEAIGKISTGLTVSGASAGMFVLFPSIPDLGAEFQEPFVFDLGKHFTESDREYIRNIFSTIWHIVFYTFSVFLIYKEIKDAVNGS